MGRCKQTGGRAIGPTAGGPRSHLRLALPALVAALSLVGCPRSPEAVQDAAEARADAEQEDAALAAMTRDEALLLIARHRDARREPERLASLRRHADPDVRAEAARALGLIGDPASAGAIQGFLEDDVPRVRAAAAFALSQIPRWEATVTDLSLLGPKAEIWLLEALEKEQELGLPPSRGTVWPAPAVAVVRALGEVGEGDAERALFGLLEKRIADPALRGQVLLALALQAKRGGREPLDAQDVARVAPMLIERAPEVQWTAAYLLARAEVAEDARELAGKALLAAWKSSGEDADLRAWVLRALGKVGGAGAAELLGSVAGDPAAPMRERLNAVRGAAALKEPALPVLAAALSDPDELVRDDAAAALGRAGGEEAWAALSGWDGGAARLSALAGFAGTAEAPGEHGAAVLAEAEAALAAEDPELRKAAYSVLSTHPDPTAAEKLLAAEETDVGAGLVRALCIAQRPEEGVVGALLQWVVGADPLLGAVAAEGLAKRDGDFVTPRLLEALAKATGPEEAERRQAIAEALFAREDVDVRDLVPLLKDPEPHVRLAAFRGLRERAGRAESSSPFTPRDFPDLPDAAYGAGDVKGAVIRTGAGDLKVELRPDVAPAAVANFVRLAESGAYTDGVFHRVVADFVIQGGDPMGTGWGGPGWTIRDEYSALPYKRGALGMARSGKDTAGSQWFLTHSPQPHLEAHYTVFGQLVEGWEVLDAVRVGESILGVDILR